MSNPIVYNNVVKSYVPDTFSGIGQVSSTSHKTKQLLFCDPLGNRGYFDNQIGVLFTSNQETVIITVNGTYIFIPEKWEFVDTENHEIVPVFISLDSVSQMHHAFSDPQANITVVESVQDHLLETILTKAREVKDYSIHDSINTASVAEAMRQLAKSMEKSLYESIPKVSDYAS